MSRRKAISEGYLYKGAAFVYDAVALPTESDKLGGIGIVGSTSVFGAAG